MGIPLLNLKGMTSQADLKIARQHVRAGLTVYPHRYNPVWGSRKTNARTFNWDSDKTEGSILSLNTIKTLGAPSGTWQATIKLRPDSDLDLAGGDIADGDWVDITILRNGVKFPVMRGVVGSVRQRKVTARGATVRVFTLTGNDHGKPFETPIAWQSIWVQTLGELVRGIMTDKVEGNVGGSPDEMFTILIKAAFEKGAAGQRSSWQLPMALAQVANLLTQERPYFWEALMLDRGSCRGAYYNEIDLWTQAGQSLHQALQQWCNPVLNEIWYDLKASSTPTMMAYIRERPFVNTMDGMSSPWFTLPTLTIPNWLIEDYDTGRDGSQRFTLFEVLADFGYGNAQEAAALAAPIWNKNDIQTHGILPWQQNVKYVAKDNKAEGDWVQERKIWQRLLADWYGPNPYLLDGTLSAGVILPEARVGMRLRYDTGSTKTTEHYYLEGVENRYTFNRDGHRGRTNLTVTRGVPGTDQDYLKLVTAAAKNYTEVF